VHSISYGLQGRLTCGVDVVHDIEVDFIALAARGVSLVFASGDAGSGYEASCGPSGFVQDVAIVGIQYDGLGPMDGVPADTCCSLAAALLLAWSFTPDSETGTFGNCTFYSAINRTETRPGITSGGNFVDPTPPTFFTNWPASSPWVTAVGATALSADGEVATQSFGSGGGFAWNFSSFDAQSAAVKGYLARSGTSLPPSGSFPVGGRATPDVAALGDGLKVISNGVLGPGGGTSASTPIFAALVSLLNEARLQDGMPPMGFLNPWLYQNPDVFTDITQGSDKFNRFGDALPYGFTCAKGWDAVTGLGTPLFDKMLIASAYPKNKDGFAHVMVALAGDGRNGFVPVIVVTVCSALMAIVLAIRLYRRFKRHLPRSWKTSFQSGDTDLKAVCLTETHMSGEA